MEITYNCRFCEKEFESSNFEQLHDHEIDCAKEEGAKAKLEEIIWDLETISKYRDFRTVKELLERLDNYIDDLKNG